MRPSKIQVPKIGDRCYEWTITSLPYIKEKKKVIDVKCNCGKTKTTLLSPLLHGRNKGCKKCSPQHKRTAEQLQSAIVNKIYLAYKTQAKERNYSFSISLDQFKSLIFQNCFYCGATLSNIKKTKVKNNEATFVKYNGIDRLDNLIGYEINNCVPCCKTCNIMKLDHSTTDFLEHIKKIIINNKLHDSISEKKLKIYHDRCLVIASQSHDIHTKVAALLIDPKTLAVMAEGYNGFIRGGPDELLPTGRPEKYDYIIHAETNLLCNCVRAGVKTDGCIIYCTLSPCVKCIRMLWQAGISEFYFKDKYKDFDESAAMLDLDIKTNQIGDFYHLIIQPRTKGKDEGIIHRIEPITSKPQQ